MTGTRPIRAAIGIAVAFYLLWAATTLLFRQVDPQALIDVRAWHAWLPFYLWRVQDVPVFLPIVLATLALVPLAWLRVDVLLTRRNVPIAVALLSLAAFVFVLWGSHAVYLDYLLSMDEYLAEYQALVYRSGEAAVAVPPEWADYRAAFFHRFLRLLDGGAQWFSMYLPVHSLLRAPFALVGAAEVLNALAVAGSIYLAADIARRLFPDDLWAPPAAALVMAGSAQLLFVGMSAYAHSMHLFLNLLWLRLYVSDRRAAFLALPWVGVLAMGLHQVHYHLLFAFPFFLYMLLQRRWRWLFYLCPIYGVAFVGFSNWVRLAELIAAGGGSVAVGELATAHVRTAAEIAGGSSSWIYNSVAGTVNFFRFFAWQHLLLAPLVIVALVQWRRLPTVVKLLAIGCAITLAARLLVTPNAGHQWGYRYFHNMLGNFALLAVAGLIFLRQRLPADWRPRLLRVLGWSSVFSMLILVPIRALQVNEFIRPYARASAYLSSLPYDVVIVDTASIWVGQDLVRNDPWLRNRPLLLNKQRLTTRQQERLQTEKSAVEIGFRDLERFGLKPYRPDRE